MNLLITILKYIAAAFLGGFFVSMLCTGFALLTGFNIADLAIGGAFIGAIWGLETIRESRKPRPLWKQHMDDYER